MDGPRPLCEVMLKRFARGETGELTGKPFQHTVTVIAGATIGVERTQVICLDTHVLVRLYLGDAGESAGIQRAPLGERRLR